MAPQNSMFSILCSSLLYWSFKVFAQELVCDPTTACTSAAAGTLVVDPEDCHSYYVCVTKPDDTVAPSIQSIACEDENYFDYTQKICTEEVYTCANPCRNHVCHHSCNMASPPSVIAGQTCDKYYYCLPDSGPIEADCKTDPDLYFDGTECSDNPYTCCDICSPYCETEYTEVFDPYDCTKYYLCLTSDYTPSEDTHFTCPSGQYFDEITSDCIDDTATCTSLCTTVVP